MGQQSEGSTLKSEGGSCEADASFFPIISHRSDTAWKIGYGLEFPVSTCSNLRRVLKNGNVQVPNLAYLTCRKGPRRMAEYKYEYMYHHVSF